MPAVARRNNLADRLVERFKLTHLEVPSWAWRIPPSIPFIGKGYRPGAGLLVYASAENLTFLSEGEFEPRYKEPLAWNRFRYRYESAGRDGAGFFPDVGIQPVNDGGLLTAAFFVAGRSGLRTGESPRAFLETIAVSNWCKFSIKGERNRDYIGNLRLLADSLAFVVGELAELRPAVAMLPQLAWRRPVLAAAMRGASPSTLFVPVPQFNATVVNTHLSDHDAAGHRLRCRSTGSQLAAWNENIRRMSKANAWRYLARLEADLDRAWSPAGEPPGI